MLATPPDTFVERIQKSFTEKFLGTSMSMETCLFQLLVEETTRSYNEGFTKGNHINRETNEGWFDAGFHEGKKEGDREGYARGVAIGIKTGHKEGFHEGRIYGQDIGYFMGYIACKVEQRNRENICGRALTQSEMMVFIEELYEIYLAAKRAGYNEGFLYGVK